MSLDTMAQTITVQTDRFDLRPLRRSDQGMIAHYGSDARLARMTVTIPHPLPPGTAEAFVSRVLTPGSFERVWIVDGTKADGPEFMGLIALECFEGSGQCELSYWVAPPFWNTGIASDAVRALVEANPSGASTMFASEPASVRLAV